MQCKQCGLEHELTSSEMRDDVYDCNRALKAKLAETDHARIEAIEARARVAAVRDKYAAEVKEANKLLLGLLYALPPENQEAVRAHFAKRSDHNT